MAELPAVVKIDRSWIGGDVIIDDVHVHPPPPPPEPKDQRWLDELRRFVRNEVEQWLADEVRGAPLLGLDKKELSEAVGRRRPVLVSARSDDRLLDPEEGLGAVFVEEAGRSLLILGEPGSGKSVLLRQLALALLERAEADPREPVPVLLDLSGWADDGRPFLDWLASADGLRRSYRGYNDAQLRAWLGERRLALLLDGLDEVRPADRPACVEAMDAFAAGTDGGAPGGLAVCCRYDEYQELAGREACLHLGAAVYLQPLTEAQVARYLAGPHLQGLLAAWHADPAVRELARNPLMLSTMSLAFERAGSALPAFGSEGVLREWLLDAYVERVFERAEERLDRQEEGDEAALPLAGVPTGAAEGLRYDPAQTIRRLRWLAGRLRNHARGTFYIEELQPSWLPPGPSRRAYAVLSRCAGGLLLGLSLGGLLLLGLGVSGTLFGTAEAAVTGGLVLALSVGGALVVSALDARRLAAPAGPDAAAVEASDPRLLPIAALLAAMGLLGALLFGAGSMRGQYGLLFGVTWGVVTAAVFEPAAGWRTAAHDVRLVEPLRWSWRSALRAARRGLGVGALGGAVVGTLWAWLRVEGRPTLRLALVAVAALGAGVVAAVVGGALGGLRQGNAEVEPRPNLGLRLSLRNAALAAAVAVLAAATVLFLLLLALAADVLGAAGVVRWSLSGGLFCGLLAALRYGGLNALYHFTLRLLLARTGHFPLDATAFLDHASDLSLMRRAGGGYTFANRFLAEHLAARDGSAHSAPELPHQASALGRGRAATRGWG